MPLVNTFEYKRPPSRMRVNAQTAKQHDWRKGTLWVQKAKNKTEEKNVPKHAM